jgi:group I intron endonuclease
MAKAKSALGMSTKVSSRKAVYLIVENLGSNRYYVGSSIDIDRRFMSYYNKQRGKRIIDYSLNKHGFNNFSKHIFELPNDITNYEMMLWEGFYIKLFGSYHYKNDLGMNLMETPTEVPSHNQNARNKISLANKGVKKEWLSKNNLNNKYALGRTGAKHPNSKKILFTPENKTFESIKDCSDYLRISRQAIRYKLNINHKDYKLI